MYGHLKSLTWRVLGAIDTMALSVAGIDVVTKTTLCLAYERAWARGSKTSSATAYHVTAYIALAFLGAIVLGLL
jgi:hypothetical protein